MCGFNASHTQKCTSGPRLSFIASLYSLRFFYLKGNEEGLSGNHGVTGGAWGSDGSSTLNTMTASACELHTDTQLAPSLEQDKTQDYQTTSINRSLNNLLW